MMAWIQVVFGYVVVGSLTALVVYRSYPEFFKRNFPALLDKPTPKQQEPIERQKTAKSKPKSKPKPKPKTAEPEAPVPDTTTSEAIVEEEGEDAVDFARSLKKVQTGTPLKKPETTAEKPKKKKGKKAGKAEESTNELANGLTNGIQRASEAIKDTASSLPSLPDAVQDTAEAFASGAAGMVSDIGAKVADSVRIREEYVPPPVPKEDAWTSIPTKGQKTQQKAAKQEETKKQRQRAAAKEREREIVVQAEELRRKKMEAQLRTARIARGEPARNGEVSNFREGPAPSKSAWNTSEQPTSQDTEVQGQMTSQYSGMLDTVDDPADAAPVEPRTPVIISDEDDVYINGTEAKNVPLLNGNA